MKRVTVLRAAAIIAVIVLAVFPLAFAKIKMIAITEENFHLLKGRWESFSAMATSSGSASVELEIDNESSFEKIKGAMTVYGGRTSGTYTDLFENGAIKDGRLFIQWGRYTWLKLALYENKKSGLTLPTLKGEWMRERGINIFSGSLTLEKVK